MLKNIDSNRTQIMIATKDQRSRERLRIALQSVNGLHIVAETSDAVELPSLVNRFHPDIVLLDSGLAIALNGAAMCLSAARVVFVVPAIERAYVLEAVRVAARAIIVSSSSPDTVRATTRSVAQGDWALNSDTVALLMTMLREEVLDVKTDPLPHHGLTSRELEVVAMISTGSTNRQIAQHLSISERTVKHHLTAIFTKLNLSSRLELAMFAVTNHLRSGDVSQVTTRSRLALVPSQFVL